LNLIYFTSKGNKNRSEETTPSNETSSRSHAILLITLEITQNQSGNNQISKGISADNNAGEISIGKFILVDLAGSEKAHLHQRKSERILEGSNINKSLLALGNCVNGLVDSYTKGTKAFIPWRDSKLTRLLKVY